MTYEPCLVPLTRNSPNSMGKDEYCPACDFWTWPRDDDNGDRKGWWRWWWNNDANDGDRNGDGTHRYGVTAGQKQTLAIPTVPQRTRVQLKAEVKAEREVEEATERMTQLGGYVQVQSRWEG